MRSQLPRPRLTLVQRDARNRLWAMLLVPDPEGEPHAASHVLESEHRTFDTLIEVIDLETGGVVADLRLGGVAAFLRDRHMVAPDVAPSGEQVFRILKLTVVPDPR